MAEDPSPRPQPEPPFPEQDLQPPGLEARMDPTPQFQAPAYEPAGKLDGKRALVTGGDSGIGRAVATLYAREGAQVAFTYLDVERPDAEETRDRIEDHDVQAVPIEADVTEQGQPQRVVERTVEELGGLDLLVNNAAVQDHVADLDELTWEHWKRTFDVNIHGYFRMTKAALPHLGPGDAIVNTGSVAGLQGRGSLLDYASTKGAIHAFTKSLARNLVDEGIRVNCVAPGPVWTPLNPAEREDVEDFGGDTGMGRPAEPEEVAPAYVFLAASADSSAITGEVLTVLAGSTRTG